MSGYGLCKCGCGQKTNLARNTDRTKGLVKGQPVRFIVGHNRRPGPDYIVDPVTGCHLWQGAKTPDGYGQLRVKGKTLTAHIHFYTQKYGPVPSGKELDHFHCDNRGCCNADHVRPVTHTENIRRGKVAKLTFEEAREIRELGAKPGGVRARDLGTIYGVDRNTIYRVLNGRNWREEAAA